MNINQDTLTFGSDLHLRTHWFVPESMNHPAKLHLGLLHWLVELYTRPGDTIADPMCGIGSILYAATLQRTVIATEIEPRWLAIAHKNAAHLLSNGGLFLGTLSVGQQDACEPWGYRADHILFSPPYGNEANTTDSKHRGLAYRLQTGKIDSGSRWAAYLAKPTNGSSAVVSFHYGTHPAQMGHFRGNRYWQAMTDIYQNAYAALGHGYLILIVKDHIAQGQRIRTADETVTLCERLGFVSVARHVRLLTCLSLWQRRRREQGLPVVEEEDVLVFKKRRANSE